MVYGEKYILERIRGGKYSRIDVFEKHIDSHHGATLFLTIRDEDNANAVQRMKDFCATSAGDFTVYLRQTNAGSWRMAEIVKIHLSRALAQLNSNATTADVESIVNARISEILSEQEREKTLRDLQEENERLKAPLERITYVVENIVTRWIPPAPATKFEPINGTEDVNLEELNKAVAGLIQKFTGAGLIALNAKLDKEPETVKMVRQFVGI